jgi:chitinase
LYNTGCSYGLDKVCYSQTKTESPDYSVALADDLLANWPTTLPNGQASGFQPYISYLKPSQVVLGYPAPNASGDSDGQAVIPTSTIIRALNCLATASTSASSCDTYIPSKPYGNIGGVFEWEITYDQSNNYKFATDLKSCVIESNCN